jgi:hypothetical protein
MKFFINATSTKHIFASDRVVRAISSYEICRPVRVVRAFKYRPKKNGEKETKKLQLHISRPLKIMFFIAYTAKCKLRDSN